MYVLTQARESGIYIFAIGIGNINVANFNAVASSPAASYVFELENSNESASSISFLVVEEICATPTNIAVSHLRVLILQTIFLTQYVCEKYVVLNNY